MSRSACGCCVVLWASVLACNSGILSRGDLGNRYQPRDLSPHAEAVLPDHGVVDGDAVDGDTVVDRDPDSGQDADVDPDGDVEPDAMDGPSHVIAWWRFDEGTGDIANDSSGNDNHGQIYGGTWHATGISGSAIALDGDDFVRVLDNDQLDLTDELTIEAWVNGTAAPFGTETLQLGVKAGKPKLTVVGDTIYYAFNAGDNPDLWFATAKLDNSGLTAHQLTDKPRVDYQLEHQVVGDEIYFVWRTGDCKLYAAKAKTNGKDYQEKELSLPDFEHA